VSAGRPWARAIGLVACVAAVAVGVWEDAGGPYTGVETPPFFLTLLEAATRTWWWPIGPLAACVLVAWRLVDAGSRVGARTFAAWAFALALVSRVVLALGDRGIDGLWRPFERDGGRRNDYVAAFPLVSDDPARFVDRFAELVPTLPVHPSGHPAGGTLLAWGIARPVGEPEGLALAVIFLGALTALPVFVLARRLLDERPARLAVLLWALAPSTLLYGATSLDAVFALLSACAVALLVAGRIAPGALVAGGVFLCSYASPLAVVWVAIVRGPRGGARIALACCVAALGLLAVAWLALGYDPVGAVRATREAYERGIGGDRPWWYWSFASPAAFLLALGPLLAERFLLGVERATAGARALAACLLLGALSGVMEAEVERIWQFAIPFAAIAAAPLLGTRHARLLLAAGVVQAIVVQALYDTTF